MERARARQAAVDNAVVEIPGEPPLLSAQVESIGDGHWKSLRRIIREARKNGYASTSVEDAMLYAAFYNKAGLTEEEIKRPDLARDLVESGILSIANAERNAVIINQIPDERGRGYVTFLPIYLYPIQRGALWDLLHGRLVIVVMVNPARVMEALEADGFRINEKKERGRPPHESFVISCELRAPNGDKLWMEMHNFSTHIWETVHEFKSVQYIVEVARAARDAAQKALPST
jgi:hypothetical protein